MEDLEEIILLKEKLYKKEKEFEMLEKEARNIQLELENQFQLFVLKPQLHRFLR
jgi:hypothetical protein